MSKIGRNVLALVSAIVIVFAGGYLAGLYFSPRLTTQTDQDNGHDHPHAGDAAIDDHGHSHAADPADDHGREMDHVALTKQAFQNLELKLGDLPLRDYWKSNTIPGEVVEIPSRSKLTISAPVTGVIESVFVSLGESVQSMDNLFDLRIADEYLTAAQSKVLAGLARADIVRQETARLAPLTSSGAVAGRRIRDLEYELAQLNSSQAVLRQEMLSHGLPAEMVANLMQDRELASLLAMTAPQLESVPDVLANQEAVRPVALETNVRVAGFAVESIDAHAGQTVQRGDKLATLSNHAELYVRGQAFETDLPILNQLAEKDWAVTAEFGHDHEVDSNVVTRRRLKLLRIDNEVGTETQTVTFYLPLRNEVVQTLRDDDGHSFVHWRFKPGQRAHLQVPVERWKNQIVLPLAAVMIDGPNATVFVQHEAETATHSHDHGASDHDHAENDGDDHDHNGHDHDGDDHNGHDHDGDDHDGDDHDGDDHDGDDHDGHDHDGHDHANGDDDLAGHEGGAHDHDGHSHSVAEDQAHDDDTFIELEPVPVHVLHRDDEFAVIANDGQLSKEQQIVLNAAYKLHQAMKMQSGGGGAQHHDHSH